MPNASSSSMMIFICGSTGSGGSSGPATRGDLYEGIASTRNCGRQSASRATTSFDGRRAGRRRERKFRKPSAAFTFVPPGAFHSGTAGYGRYARLAASTRSAAPAIGVRRGGGRGGGGGGVDRGLPPACP